MGGKTLLVLYHMARKEFELAIGAFREALSAQPTDAWSLTHLAQSLQALGRAEEARDAYQRAIHINPNEALARKGLAGLAKVRGDLEAYETHLDVCRRLIPKDPWVQSEMLAQEEQADPAAAITRREELAAENPDDVGNLRRLASLCETIHDLTRADAYYDRILALRSDDRDTILLAARYYRRTDRPERALDLLNRFTASRPTASQRADAQILVAGHHLAQGHDDRAEEALLAAAKSTQTPEPARSLAQFYRTTRDDPRRALVWFDKAVDRARQTQSPLLPRVLEARAACRLDHRINDTASAGRDVAELLERFPNESSAYLLSSEIHAREGRIDEAVAALSEHLTKRPNDPYALYRRARHEATRGRLAGAIADLEAAKRAAPLALRLEPRILLASLYDRSDRKDLWIHELESLAAEAPDDPRALEELVRAYLRERRSDDADRIITAQINRTQDKPEAEWFQLRGTVSLEVGEFEKALGDFHRAAQIEDFSAASLTQVFDAYLQIGRYEDGVAYGRQHAMESRNDPVLLSRYGALLARSGQIEEAVEQLHRAMARALTDRPEATLVVAGALPTALADPADLAQAVTLLRRRPAQGVAGRARDRLLARLHQMADRLDDAVEVLESLIQTADGDNERATLLQEMGDVHQLADHPDRARRAYEEGLKYAPDNWVALNNLAYLLTHELDQSERALPYARRAVELTDNPAALDTLGWTYVGLQQYPAAIAELSRASRLAPGDASTLYHLGEAYRRDGQFTEATGVLQNALGIAQTQGNDRLRPRIEDARARARQRDAAP
ncbi:MAG: tetratricopeptide repeat protein [Chloroflexi bacterium]|nr:tetratricopeptide repeat protein [Chloroflexota bacterium]